MSKIKKNVGKFHIEFLNAAQKLAWAGFQQHDVMFMIGPAGTGKTYLAMAFAIHELLQGSHKKIILTRPIVEAGESLGYLPGDLHEKTGPYMLPLVDSMKKLAPNPLQHDTVAAAIEVAPLAYLRGRTFDNAIAIFDEAQNASRMQLKLFLTRLGENSKIIITGDPSQSDIGESSGLMDVVSRLDVVPGICVVRFKEDSIVRHPLVSAMLAKLES
ncbi:MAG: PhoH family protein [Proteobacteria bacterium]|jgi:phosphate starvation-inducible PhoH-like protein|nr:PhoH family protein [Pseudomonadota bacterium]